jgi:hypothetical protein
MRSDMRKLVKSGKKCLIPLDVVPVFTPINNNSSFLQEILKGEIIYEKRD